MVNRSFRAKLVNYSTIEISLVSPSVLADNFSFCLLKNDKYQEKLKVIRKTSAGVQYYFVLQTSAPLALGNAYTISAPDFGVETLHVEDAVDFENFDEDYYFDGELGAIYSKNKTTFRLWAPTASFVLLNIAKPNEEFMLRKMVRKDKGVYEITLDGDYALAKYQYFVTVSGVTRETTDPYGLSVNTNSEYSVVIDLSKVDELGTIKPKSEFKNPVDALIYETHIRDFTQSKYTDIERKGEYLGLVEEGRKTEGGNPAGLDYLKYLGITHLQIQPVHDSRGVDDIERKEYNWGYDGISYFALEGSFSSDPENGLTRMLEFKTMVNKLHENDIRVVCDVVYNHIYDYLNSTFEKCVPHYYFRKKADGGLSNASGCGDDINTARKMARRLIVDSVKHLLKHFDIDGLRFDLMGLIDKDTINQIKDYCLKAKPHFLLYGEGWDMCYELTDNQKVTLSKAKGFPQIGFFNDAYRDIIKGSTFSLYEKGYGLGNTDYHYGFAYAFNGSTVDNSYPAKFNNANQSINYVECHDNHTLFDKMNVAFDNADESALLKRVEFINALLLLSFGVPFLHMGQEVGLSKKGLGNTYNVYKVNNMKWKKVDERFDMVNNLKIFIKLRKLLPYTHLYKEEDIRDRFTFDQKDNGLLFMRNEKDNVLIIVNPTDKMQLYSLEADYGYVGDNEFIVNQNGIIPPTDVYVLEKRK